MLKKRKKYIKHVKNNRFPTVKTINRKQVYDDTIFKYQNKSFFYLYLPVINIAQVLDFKKTFLGSKRLSWRYLKILNVCHVWKLFFVYAVIKLVAFLQSSSTTCCVKMFVVVSWKFEQVSCVSHKYILKRTVWIRN